MRSFRTLLRLLPCLLVASPALAADARFDVTAYGAVGDGQAVNTRAIGAAIAACSQAGGGVVYFPPGEFLSGTLELQSHCDLHLESGAVLKGSPDIDHYQTDQRGEVAETAYLGLIVAREARNISITGRGAIDGNGTSFMDVQSLHVADDFVPGVTRQRQDFMHPRFGTADGPVKPRARPGDMIVIESCQDVLIADVHLLDTPTWTTRIANSSDVVIRGITIRTNLSVPNADGIHCTSSRNVRISDALIESGDDAIAITGFGRKGRTTENVHVSNSTLLSRSAGVRVGYGADTIRNCTFQNLVITGSNRGLGVFVRGAGSVENVLFDSIVIDNRLHTGHWWGKGEPIHVSALPGGADAGLGRVSNVRFSNIVAHSETGIVVWARDPGHLEDVEFDGVQLTVRPGPLSESYGGNIDVRPAATKAEGVFARDLPGLLARNARRLVIRDFDLRWEEGLPDFFTHGIEAEDVEDLLIEGYTGRQAHATGAAIVLRRVRGVSVLGSRAAPGTDFFLTHEGVEDARAFLGNAVTEANALFAPNNPGFELQ